MLYLCIGFKKEHYRPGGFPEQKRYRNMKEYIASYTNGKNECWDLVLSAKNWKAAHKDAKRYERENPGDKLYSVRRKK